MNDDGFRQNMEFQAQKLQTINLKTCNLLNYKLKKIKIKCVFRANKKIEFYCNAFIE